MTEKENFAGDTAAEENATEQAVDNESVESAESQNTQTDLGAELEKANAAAEDYKRKWYAVSAEYDNYRKRTKDAVSTAFADGKA